MARNADVVVIGAGSIGTAVTYALSKAGAKVILVEAGDIAEGTSGKCDGNILVSDKMPGYDVALAKKSQDMFPKLSDELSYDVEWSQNGSLQMIENETEMAQAHEYAKGLAASEIPVRILTQQQCREDEPLMSHHVIGGLEVDCDGAVQPMALCFGYANAAKKLGAKVLNQTVVSGIERDENGRVSKVITSNGDIICENIVNSAGVWSKEIGAFVGLDIPVRPRQGHVLVSERTFKVARRKVVEFGYLMAKFQGSDYKRDVPPDVLEYAIAFVFEPTHSSNFLLGSSRRYVGFDTMAHPEVMKAQAARAIHFFPCIKNINIIRTYVGLRPSTADHFPIVSGTDVPGFYIATGHEGDGIGLAPISGEIICSLITGTPTDFDISPLDFNRFA